MPLTSTEVAPRSPATLRDELDRLRSLRNRLNGINANTYDLASGLIGSYPVRGREVAASEPSGDLYALRDIIDDLFATAEDIESNIGQLSMALCGDQPASAKLGGIAASGSSKERY